MTTDSEAASDAGYVIPTPSEWRRRTWYGRLKLLPEIALWVIGTPFLVVVLVAFVLSVGIVFGIPLAHLRARQWLSERTPEVYRNGE